MNSLGMGIRVMRTLEDIEKVAGDLMNRHAKGSVGYVLGAGLLDLLNAGRVERAPSIDEHTEGAPETSSHCQNLEETVEYLRGACVALRGENKTLRDRIERTSSNYKQLEKENEKLRDMYDEKSAQFRNAKGDLEQHRKLVGRMKSEISTFGQQAKADADTVWRMKDEAKEMSDDIITLRHQLLKERQAADEARDQVEELQNQRDAHQEHIRELQKQRDAYRDQAVQLVADKKDPVAGTGRDGAINTVERTVKHYTGAHTGRIAEGFGGFQKQPETDSEMKQRLGLDAAAWAKEFAATVCRANSWSGTMTGQKIEELAIGWFANLIHHAETYVPRNKSGDVIFRMGPEREVLERWAKDGYFDHYSDAARMVMEFCQIPTHKYIQVQNIMERFGEVKWCEGAAAGSQADSDTKIDHYSAGIKDTAARLKNVLDREGFLPPEQHPEQAQ